MFETLQDTGHTYDQAITKLNEHFDVKKLYHLKEVCFERRNKKQMNH